MIKLQKIGLLLIGFGLISLLINQTTTTSLSTLQGNYRGINIYFETELWQLRGIWLYWAKLPDGTYIDSDTFEGVKIQIDDYFEMSTPPTTPPTTPPPPIFQILGYPLIFFGLILFIIGWRKKT